MFFNGYNGIIFNDYFIKNGLQISELNLNESVILLSDKATNRFNVIDINVINDDFLGIFRQIRQCFINDAIHQDTIQDPGRSIHQIWQIDRNFAKL